MADWTVINAVSKTLKRILEERSSVGEGFDVKLVTPAAFETLAQGVSTRTIGLFLYRVMEHTECRNRSSRIVPDGRELRQPLALELCYIVTAWSAQRRGGSVLDLATEERAVEDEQRLLGLVLRTFDEFSEIPEAHLWRTANEPSWHPNDGIQLILESLPIEDHYRIWDASELGYRTSLTYRARVIGIDPAFPVHAPRTQETVLIAGEV